MSVAFCKAESKKKATALGGAFLGTHLQNLPRLFEWVVDNVGGSVNVALSQPKELEVEVIY